MPVTDDLNQYIAADDYKGFLRAYFEIIDSGQNLSLPASLELGGIREGWSEILANIAGGYTDEFIDSLSQYWAQLVKKQGGVIGDQFSKQILALIDGQPMPKDSDEAISAEKKNTTEPSARPAPPQPRPSVPDTPSYEPSDMTENPIVESRISQNYYHFQAATEFKIPEEKQLQKLIKSAIQSELGLAFIVYHLAAHRRNKMTVPMSSVISTIQQRWEEILLGIYHTQPETPFIKAISALWFNAVNLKGLPASPEKMEDIFNHFIQAFQKEKAEKDPMPQKSTPHSGNNPLFSKIRTLFKK